LNRIARLILPRYWRHTVKRWSSKSRAALISSCGDWPKCGCPDGAIKSDFPAVAKWRADGSSGSRVCQSRVPARRKSLRIYASSYDQFCRLPNQREYTHGFRSLGPPSCLRGIHDQTRHNATLTHPTSMTTCRESMRLLASSLLILFSDCNFYFAQLSGDCRDDVA